MFTTWSGQKMTGRKGGIVLVRNYMETLVENALEGEISENAHKYPTLCHCPACMAAMKAYSLNNLKPFYVTGTAGEVYGEYHHKELQNYSDILVAVALGIEELQRQDPYGHCALRVSG